MFASAKHVYTYAQFIDLCQKTVDENTSTSYGEDERYAHFSKLNLQRMLRLNKTFSIPEDDESDILDISHQEWWVITEGWCGDSAQVLPVLNKIAALNPKINLKIILREENPDIMNHFLTNGSKSIPKLISIRKSAVRFVWGPRPEACQKLYDELKNANTPFEELEIAIQKWYNQDEGRSILMEIANCNNEL